MDSTLTLEGHHAWRLGQGGTPACLSGGCDSGSYAGLDLDLIQISATVFSGSNFSAVTFRQACWTGCTFQACHFSGCDFDSLTVSDCVFNGCSFSQSSFSDSRFIGCRFWQCRWDGLNFNAAQWRDVAVLDCSCIRITGERVWSEAVDFTGSHFEHLEFNNARINE